MFITRCKYFNGRIVAIVLAIVIASTSVTLAQNAYTKQLDALFANVNDTIAPFYISINKDGKQVYNFSTSGGAVSAITRYRVASSSKWLVAATILSLKDNGFIRLEDKVSKYLKSFSGNKTNITIAQLLSHTSGLPSSSPFIKSKTLTLVQSVDSIGLKTPLDNLPGSTFNYGSVSFQVAARVAEVATGKDWETIFAEFIAKPCGMKNSDFGNKAIKDIGDGGHSTAHDFQLFIEMIRNNGNANGKQVLTETSVLQMLTNQIANTPVGYTLYKLKSSQYSRFYGLGVWLDRVLPNEILATEVSSYGGRGFSPWINTCKGITVVLSTYGRIEQIQPTIDAAKNIINAWFPDKCNDLLTADITILPPAFTLDANNNNQTVIGFSLKESAVVGIRLFDPLGNEVAVVFKGTLPAGKHELPVYAQGLKAGIYFYELTVNDLSVTKKLNIKGE